MRARPRSLHSQNELHRIAEVLDALGEDRDVALVSDAGTPLISDPGARLVAAVLEAGHRVEAVPGASAVLSAVTVSGLRTHPFAFLGFLPRKGAARRRLIESYRGRPETLVLFESPRRVVATLRDLAAVLGDRPACAARELTKLYEEVARGTLSELADRFGDTARGEFTLVVEGALDDEGVGVLADADELEARLRSLVDAGRSPREVAAELAPVSGVPKRELYARAVQLRGRAAAERGEP